jgi:hypothetical protein
MPSALVLAIHLSVGITALSESNTLTMLLDAALKAAFQLPCWLRLPASSSFPLGHLDLLLFWRGIIFTKFDDKMLHALF